MAQRGMSRSAHRKKQEVSPRELASLRTNADVYRWCILITQISSRSDIKKSFDFGLAFSSLGYRRDTNITQIPALAGL